MPVDVLLTEFASRGAGRLNADLNMLASSFGRVETAQQSAMRRSMGLAAAGGVGLAALSKLAVESVKKASEVQTTRAGFATLLGSAEKARKLYSDIEKFSLTSPLNNAQTAKGAQLLLATGTAADKVVPRLAAISNASSSAGGGQERFDGILRALSKIELRSKVSTTQLNQIALRGVNPFKILQRELALTAAEVADIGHQGIKGSVAVEALVRGMAKIGGGKADENLNKTLAGQLSQAEDATDQLKAKLGELILPDATAFVGQLTAAVSRARELVKAHPRATKAAFYGGAAVSAGAVAYGTIRTLQLAKLARQALEKAVKSDTTAEIAKTGVAGKEAAAIAGTGNAAMATAGKLGILARTGALLRNPITIRGASMATSAAFGGGRGALGALGGLGAQGGAKMMGLVTTGGAMASVALGAAAAVQATGNMKAAGYTDGQSYMYAAATGIGAAGAAMFLPGGAVAVAVGMAGAALVNKLVNEPMERKAELGSGAENTDIYGSNVQGKLEAATKSRDHNALAGVYAQMSEQADKNGDHVMAQSYAIERDSQKRAAKRESTFGSPEYLARLQREAAPGAARQLEQAKREQTPEAMARYHQEQEERFANMQAERLVQGVPGNRASNPPVVQEERFSDAPTGRDARGNLSYNRPGPASLTPSGQAQNTQTRNHDGTTVVRVVQEFVLKEGPGDAAARRRRSNTMTPAPVG